MKTSKIKILHIQESVSFGGVERRRLSLAKNLDNNIFQQKLICTTHRGALIEDIRSHGVEVYEIGKLNSPFNWAQHKKVQKIIDDYKPDIIHGAVFEGVTMAVVNGWIKKVPIIIIEETSDPKNRTWKGHFLMKIFSKIANRVVGVSQSVTDEYLKEKLGISDRKVVLINNGVALPTDVSDDEIIQLQKQWNVKPDDFVIGSTGRMLDDEHKRFSDLINAFASFAKTKNNVKLLLVGDGPVKAVYEKQVIDLGLADKVIFTGYQSNVTMFYKMMTVFALASSREAFGLVLAEAMLNKLPIVATKVGGMKYIVEDNKTGFLVPAYNTAEISQKFEILFNDVKLREEFGSNGFKKALCEFTEENYTKKVETLYLQLIKEIK